MKTKTKQQIYEAKSMMQFILEGHNELETAKEFRVSKRTVGRRLSMLGYTYADLLELKKKQGS